MEAGGRESEKVPEEQGVEGIDINADDPVVDDINNSAEAQEARIKPSPTAHTASEVAKHDATHVLYLCGGKCERRFAPETWQKAHRDGLTDH